MYIVTDAQLIENGGRFALISGPAVPITYETDTALIGGPAVPVYLVGE